MLIQPEWSQILVLEFSLCVGHLRGLYRNGLPFFYPRRASLAREIEGKQRNNFKFKALYCTILYPVLGTKYFSEALLSIYVPHTILLVQLVAFQTYQKSVFHFFQRDFFRVNFTARKIAYYGLSAVRTKQKLFRLVSPERTLNSCNLRRMATQTPNSATVPCRLSGIYCKRNPITRPFSVKCPRNCGPILRPSMMRYACTSLSISESSCSNRATFAQTNSDSYRTQDYLMIEVFDRVELPPRRMSILLECQA